VGLSLTERHQVEREFHDHKSGHERRDFYTLGALDAADHYVRRLLGDVRGQTVLELGCGTGENTIWLAAGGAEVHATDISAGMVDTTLRRVGGAGLGGRVHAQQMSAEHLAYADASFDLVFGHSVLHHTDLAITRAEVRRVLRPGGRAVFLEPLGHNPLLAAFRALTPGRRTPTERPLSDEDMRFFAEPFASMRHREFYLLALAAFPLWPLGSRVLFQAALAPLTRLDDALLARRPGLGRYAWVTVVELTR
jgi:ubiquinone/menaquinone biosynthesis C-methylase UbiE